MKRYSIVSGVVSATIALQLVFTSTALQRNLAAMSK